MSNKIDWNKTFYEYLKFNGSATEFCNTRNITKGQLFYYKKKFLEAGTTFCPININKSEMEPTENINLSNNSENVINIDKVSIVYLACGVTDLRKSIDGLILEVETQLKLDPFEKALSIFGKSNS